MKSRMEKHLGNEIKLFIRAIQAKGETLRFSVIDPSAGGRIKRTDPEELTELLDDRVLYKCHVAKDDWTIETRW